MCGIAGLWQSNLKAVDRTLLQAFTDQVIHRGPDDRGLYCDDQVGLGLGHRRLAILDLSPAGHQPMSNPDGQCWLVYNGEIYNYLELAAELTQLGYCFRSHCDTEVILAAYDAWGYDCLHRFNGMFAFLLWDARKQVLWAARDRFGVKPLYIYERSNQFIAFASEIKQFTVLPGWQARLNHQRAYDFLAHGISNHTSETLFASVWQLRGGEYLTLNIDKAQPNFGQPQVFRWYQLPETTQTLTLTEASTAFLNLLQDSVKLRLQADVTVGSCLSGGLDSSSIVCLADRIWQQTTADPFQTFSSCSTNPQYDESRYVQSVVETTQVQPHYVFPSEQGLFQLLDRLTWHQDEPFYSTSMFAQWCVFQKAKDTGVKVVLDGQGADESLAGYHPFYTALFRDLLQQGKVMQFIQELWNSPHSRSIGSLGRILEPLMPTLVRRSLRQMLGYASDERFPTWMNHAHLTSLGLQPKIPAVKSDQAYQSIRTLSGQQLTASNLPMLLHWEDRNSMAHSIESRVPFLDYRLVEFIYTLDDSLKLHHGQTKVVLRSAMQGILPETIRTRRDKMGFVTPEPQWLRETARDQFQAEFEQATTILGRWIDPLALNQLIQRIMDGTTVYNPALWRIISFSHWVKVFNVQGI